MVMSAREKQSDLIKMKSGKKELPIGIYSRKSGGYELRRSANGQRYHFGTVHNLELALAVNSGIDKLVNDYRAEVNSKKNGIESLVIENGMQNVSELTRQIDELKVLLDEQTEIITNQSNLISREIYREKINRSVVKKLTLRERLTGYTS